MLVSGPLMCAGVYKVAHGLDEPDLGSYDGTPLSAAILFAFAIASAILTDPLLIGLIELKSTLPVFEGWGR